jgi:2-polyprenyl-6-hydroxyphenyl methylase/3-demethylubiquinone-9 3-methyltransferase
MSLEVVEHVYSPRDFAQTIFDVLVPGGLVILSTPYHGYLKNLLIAITNSYDRHHDPLWDHGHIKFWSMDTLSQLLEEIGFAQIRFDRVGRIPPLAKSMIALARKPEGVSEDQRS